MSEVKKRQKSIVIFTSPSCVWCTRAKSYFKKRGLKFRAIDITKDKRAASDCLKHGCKGIPVILIDTYWICGFDEKKIEKVLG